MQLIKDIVSVSESTNWMKVTSAQAKYKALGCHLRKLTDTELNKTIAEVHSKMDM